MAEAYEKKVVIGYLRHLLSAGRLSLGAMEELCGHFTNVLWFLEVQDEDEVLLEKLDDFRRASRTRQSMRGVVKSVRQGMQDALDREWEHVCAARPGSLEKNIRQIVSELQLSGEEGTVLGLMLRYHVYPFLYELLNDLGKSLFSVTEVCAACLGMREEKISKLLGSEGRLLNSGLLVQRGSYGRDIDDYYDLPKVVKAAFRRAAIGCEDVRTFLLGPPAEASLQWRDYEYIAGQRDRLAQFLRQAAARQLVGVNILLYGPPGTGKTEFCKTLAAHLGYKLYPLAEQNEDGDEPDRDERISRYRLSQNLLRYQRKSLLLFDEMDDLFGLSELVGPFGVRKGWGSKVYMNRLFETNPVPTIWTINDVNNLDESIIRRMSLAIEMKIPPPASRQRVWRRHMEQVGVELPDEVMKRLARSEVAPAVVANAVRFAHLIGGKAEDFQFASDSILKAIKGAGALTAERVEDPFNSQLVAADCDLETFSQRICTAQRRDFSLFLYGPPGTGKSAFVRYLADRLQMPVLQKRASDLISKWVGESEKNIAQAFAEARESESFLVFDEADSVLGDRKGARANWEVSLVNEMLTWMEQHPLPFACTTNLKGHLDAAAMRRFTFKLYFGYLAPEQVVLAFRHFFGLSLGLGQAASLVGLTPGDFAVVRKKAVFLDICDRDTYVELLRQEVRNKNESVARPVGFKPAVVNH